MRGRGKRGRGRGKRRDLKKKKEAASGVDSCHFFFQVLNSVTWAHKHDEAGKRRIQVDH